MIVALLAALLGSGDCPLPLRAGVEWTYRAAVTWTSDSGSGTRHRTITWRTTVLTAKASGAAEAATVLGWPTDLAWWKPGRTPTISVIYCTAGRLYRISIGAGAAEQLADSLLSGTRQPLAHDLVLDLPLRTGRLFGRDSSERRDSFYAWFVEQAEPTPSFLHRMRRGSGDSLYSVAYRTLPDHTIVGFVPGLGVTRYVYAHHGTVAEVDARLVAYNEARP